MQRIRCIVPGRCFRYETIDASHENTFHQCEGLMIDRNISIANLIAPYPTLSEVSKRVAGSYYTPSLFSDRTRKLVGLMQHLP